MLCLSCAHEHYTAYNFNEQTSTHQLLAILPAEMIYTGTQPKNMTPGMLDSTAERESQDFQFSLYNNILRYANYGRYETTVNFQDINTTIDKLKESQVSIKDSWQMDDVQLAKTLGVDAVIRLRIRKQRYMSDAASYGIDAARQIIGATAIGTRIPIPGRIGRTNDVYATCSVVSNNRAIWSDSYKGVSDWNTPANEIIENITANFGRHFPYKQKRSKR